MPKRKTAGTEGTVAESTELTTTASDLNDGRKSKIAKPTNVNDKLANDVSAALVFFMQEPNAIVKETTALATSTASPNTGALPMMVDADSSSNDEKIHVAATPKTEPEVERTANPIFSIDEKERALLKAAGACKDVLSADSATINLGALLNTVAADTSAARAAIPVTALDDVTSEFADEKLPDPSPSHQEIDEFELLLPYNPPSNSEELKELRLLQDEYCNALTENDGLKIKAEALSARLRCAKPLCFPREQLSQSFYSHPEILRHAIISVKSEIKYLKSKLEQLEKTLKEKLKEMEKVQPKNLEKTSFSPPSQAGLVPAAAAAAAPDPRYASNGNRYFGGRGSAFDSRCAAITPPMAAAAAASVLTLIPQAA